jgi:hypothetical protein
LITFEITWKYSGNSSKSQQPKLQRWIIEEFQIFLTLNCSNSHFSGLKCLWVNGFTYFLFLQNELIGRKTGNFLLFISSRNSNPKLRETEIFKIKTCLPLKFVFNRKLLFDQWKILELYLRYISKIFHWFKEILWKVNKTTKKTKTWKESKTRLVLISTRFAAGWIKYFLY